LLELGLALTDDCLVAACSLLIDDRWLLPAGRYPIPRL
jgi:hypothetical protein